MADDTLTPQVRWAQRKDLVYIKIDVDGLEKEKPNVQLNEDSLLFESTHEGKHYKVELPFHDKVDVETSKYDVRPRYVEFVIKKAAGGGEYWPRLLNNKNKYHWLKVDWNKWKDEDEDDDPEEFGDFDGTNFGGAGGPGAGAPGDAGGAGGFDMSALQGMMGGAGGAGGAGGFDMSALQGMMGGAGGLPGGDFDIGSDDDDEQVDTDDEMPPLE
jgi:CS domain